jgi:glycerol-3-phosphate dehydrogenase
MLAFSAETRRDALTRMAEREVDVLVVGGGITGSGIALDAVARGLDVALVERDDFASGTSGRSSRMVHGGVRYLPQGHLWLVHEALRERAVLARNAPHLIRPVPMLVQASDRRDRALWRLGLLAYDALAGRRAIRRRRAPAGQVARVAPGLRRPVAGLVYTEARTDDARLTLEVAREAAARGALVANHAEATALLGDGRVTGAVLTDRVGGERLEVRARATVNAAGVWADLVQAMATEVPVRLRPSKGVHVVFAPGAIDAAVPVVLPSVAGDGRWLFTVPWGDRTYVGTTDTLWEGSLEEPAVTDQDLDYVVAAVAGAFPSVGRRDVVASWAGLRPLLGHGEHRTADLSRRHAIYESPPGLFTVTGGKLTTYRLMAEELVDRVEAALGRRTPCRTAGLRIGLTGPLPAALEEAGGGARAAGLPAAVGHRFVERFGDDWPEALGLIADDPSLAEPLAPGLPVLAVEAELARTREMAVTDEDVLVRRTRITTMDSAARPGSAWSDRAPLDAEPRDRAPESRAPRG